MNNGGQGQLKIFISHKHEDRELAEFLDERMRILSADRIKCFISEQIPTGTDWLDWIKESLLETQVLIMLFTDPSADWDWLLYEAGLYTRLDQVKQGLVICIHNPNIEPPEPIKNLQAVKANQEDMEQFLKKFFGTTEILDIESPINETFARSEEDLPRLAEEICNKFSQRPETDPPVYFTRQIVLEVDPTRIEDGGIPGDSIVKSDRESLALFNLEGSPPVSENWIWQDLLDQSEDKAWAGELEQAIAAATKGQLGVPMTMAFVSARTQQSFRPVLHKREAGGETAMTYTVLLVLQPEAPSP